MTALACGRKKHVEPAARCGGDEWPACSGGHLSSPRRNSCIQIGRAAKPACRSFRIDCPCRGSANKRRNLASMWLRSLSGERMSCIQCSAWAFSCGWSPATVERPMSREAATIDGCEGSGHDEIPDFANDGDSADDGAVVGYGRPSGQAVQDRASRRVS